MSGGVGAAGSSVVTLSCIAGWPLHQEHEDQQWLDFLDSRWCGARFPSLRLGLAAGLVVLLPLFPYQLAAASMLLGWAARAGVLLQACTRARTTLTARARPHAVELTHDGRATTVVPCRAC